jgi:diacylglycerol kinase family enzyme
MMASGPHSDFLDLRRREVAILANPTAGRRGSRGHLADLVASLRAERLQPLVCWERDELSGLVSRRRAELRGIVAAGGDGTLAEVLNRAPGVPVALLPLGNENLVARYFGINDSVPQVARTVVAGRLHWLDLLRVRDRLASLMVGVGFDADVVHSVHRRRDGHVNKLSYVRPILQALWDYRFPPIEVEIADTGERLRGAMVFVFNLPCYGLDLPLASEARPDDGLLDVYVFERPGRRNLARYVWAVVCRRQRDLPDHQHRVARCVRLAAEPGVPAQADGDPAGLLPVQVQVVPAALPLIVPEPR